jgi:transcription elongation GreA/GreB family factor
MLMQKAVYNKNDLRNFVKEMISGKVKSLEFYLNFTLEASRDIKKTTKYDSIREEIQSEIYHLDKQMFSLKNMQRQMQKVLNSSSETVKLGSVVITNKARFYISVSLGEFFYEGDRFYAISEESPMAKTMKGKKVGDEFTLNNIHQKIEDIF